MQEFSPKGISQWTVENFLSEKPWIPFSGGNIHSFWRYSNYCIEFVSQVLLNVEGGKPNI